MFIGGDVSARQFHLEVTLVSIVHEFSVRDVILFGSGCTPELGCRIAPGGMVRTLAVCIRGV